MAGTGRWICSRRPGSRVHLSHPSGNDWAKRRVKNDERDARDLAGLVAAGASGRGWIASPAMREIREFGPLSGQALVLRSGLKAQMHAVMAKEGALPRLSDMFGSWAARLLDEMVLGYVYRLRVESLGI